ncbi:MAG TPA: RNA-binding domain-containing protein [Chitinophagales bacterium]|nr:RNA-binding domain-containing protein [Chitinophagales bacterium]
MANKENQKVEYKESWRDDFLKNICAFANTDGGYLHLGVDDLGQPKPLTDLTQLLEMLPNKIQTTLKIIPDIKVKTLKGSKYILIKVDSSTEPISYRGQYYKRSGSTNQELKGAALQKFLLNKGNISWDEVVESKVPVKEIDNNAINSFKKLSSPRVKLVDKAKSPITLLSKLHLIKNGKLTRAAVLLFAKNPQKYFPNSIIRIGRFSDDDSLIGDLDEIKGCLFKQIENVMEVLKKKYLRNAIRTKQLRRTENLEYPEAALREALVNAVVHRNYLGIPTTIRIYANHLAIWNSGELPQQLNIEKLRKPHNSYPANGLIAQIFYNAGYVEKWGQGTVNMIKAFKSANLPEPIYEQVEDGIRVTFLRRKTSSGTRLLPSSVISKIDEKIMRIEKELSIISTDDEVKLTLNEVVFFDLLDGWVGELLEKLVYVSQKFNRFFNSPRHHIFVLNNIGQVTFVSEDPKNVVEQLRESCETRDLQFNPIRGDEKIQLSLFYGTFRKGGLKTFGLNSSFEIEFNTFRYKVSMEEFNEIGIRQKKEEYEKLLHKPLTTAEIDSLVAKMGDTLFQHIDFYTKKQGIL